MNNVTNSLEYYNCLRNNYKKCQKYKYYNFIIILYYEDLTNEEDIVKKLNHILNYFKKYITNDKNIYINILKNNSEKKISLDWRDFLSGFFIRNKFPKTVYITRFIEWERTLIHELVHCIFNITNEIETEYKTIEIYKELFFISNSQYDHSYKIYINLIKMFNCNLINYLSSYLLNNLDQTSENKCKCDINKNFRYLCN
jgi:hypothetical protein